MRKGLIVCFMCLLAAGCSERTIVEVDFVCEEDMTEKIAAFTLRCIEGANPKSDEEPEDWIKLCPEMAEKTYCRETQVEFTQWRDCSGCAWRTSKKREISSN